MMLSTSFLQSTRMPWTRTYADGRMVVFDPLLRWRFEPPFWEVSLRNDWGVGAMRGFTLGGFSRFRTRYVRVGGWTFYLHMGMCEPHDPRRLRDRAPRSE